MIEPVPMLSCMVRVAPFLTSITCPSPSDFVRLRLRLWPFSSRVMFLPSTLMRSPPFCLQVMSLLSAITWPSLAPLTAVCRPFQSVTHLSASTFRLTLSSPSSAASSWAPLPPL